MAGRQDAETSVPQDLTVCCGRKWQGLLGAVVLTHEGADYPVVNHSEPLFVFLLAISQLISFVLRMDGERGIGRN